MIHLQLHNSSPFEKIELIITGIVKNTVPHVRVISSEQEDVPRGFLSKERITEEFGITGKKGEVCE